MKRMICMVLCFAMLMLTGCDLIPGLAPAHTHKYVEGKCECGEVNPNYKPPHNHEFVNGKCECGKTDPNYKPPHEHKFVDGECKCGERDPDYVPPHEHAFVEGKCECGEKDPDYVPEPLDKSKTYNVLFIGNSYTYYNEIQDIFAEIARAAGYTVNATRITCGGWTLEKMADPTTEYGAQVEAALTGDVKYDFVVLQEQSQRPARDSEVASFYSAVRNLAGRIREAGAEPILYATWGRDSASTDLNKDGWTNESMTWRLAAAYQAIGDELDIAVAHTGLAFYEIYTGTSGVNPYSGDTNSHPSLQGSCLAAATLFAEIFHAKLGAGLGSYDKQVGGKLNSQAIRAAATNAVFNTPEIPEEYKTTSVGVGN